MKRIFVDFEMNPIQRRFTEARCICQNEIIEIGAVLLDDENEERAHFKMYVKPEYNVIAERYERLTGVTNKIVATAPAFEEAMLEFLIWCEDQCKDDEVTIYAWSESDLCQMQSEMQLKSVDIDVFGLLTTDWKDYQKEFCNMLGIEHIISLECAVKAIGELFTGRMHDALCDARNTAKIFSCAMDKEIFNEKIRPITEVFIQTEPTTYSLGELFKEKNFGFSVA